MAKGIHRHQGINRAEATRLARARMKRRSGGRDIRQPDQDAAHHTQEVADRIDPRIKFVDELFEATRRLLLYDEIGDPIRGIRIRIDMETADGKTCFGRERTFP